MLGKNDKTFWTQSINVVKGPVGFVPEFYCCVIIFCQWVGVLLYTAPIPLALVITIKKNLPLMAFFDSTYDQFSIYVVLYYNSSK